MIDAGQAAGGLNMTVMRDGFPWTFQIAIGAQSVAQTTIENPSDGAVDVGSGVSITTSAFFTYPNGVDTHASTDWQVATDSGFTSIVFESLDDAVNLEAIAVPSGTFNTSTTYYIRARHTGTTLGDGPYSATVSFTTAASFYPSTEVAKLLASDGAANDSFGWSVAIDGDYAIIGASYPSTTSGEAAYIFERDGAGNWSQVAILSGATGRFGYSVGISGDYAIVGAPFVNSSRGSAYIYERDGGGNWSLAETVTGDATGDQFGASVAISSLGQAVIGAPEDDDQGSGAGTAYIYERDGSGAWPRIQKLTASDGGSSKIFGTSVAIDGGRAIVGSPYGTGVTGSSGTAYIFERDGSGSWIEEAKLFALDGAAIDFFGISVAIDGDYAIVGSREDDDKGSGSGSAYIYVRDGFGSWSQDQKLTASDGAANEAFGHSVGISGDYAIVGNRYLCDGYIFERDGSGVWSEVAILDVANSSSGQGSGMAISGARAIIGASGDDTTASNAGAAYVFE